MFRARELDMTRECDTFITVVLTKSTIKEGKGKGADGKGTD